MLGGPPFSRITMRSIAWQGEELKRLLHYYMAFHTFRIQREIDDSALWERIDINLQTRTLKLKQQSEFNPAIPKRFNPGSHTGLLQASSSSAYTSNACISSQSNLPSQNAFIYHC